MCYYVCMQIRKKNILNLIKYHADKNENGFKNEAYDIARYFDSIGDSELAQYIMALLSGTNTFVPQDNEYNLPFFIFKLLRDAGA